MKPSEQVERHHDALIVGLGAAGCWAAHCLTARGMDVLALDAGKRLTPDDLPQDLPPASLASRAFASHRRIQSRSVSFHPKLSHLYVDDRANPYDTRGGDPFLWIRGRQVGGRLHTWARMALRLSDRDLHAASADGRGADWPLDYADLAPFYDEVERFHGLRGHADGLAHLPDGVASESAALRPPAALFRESVTARWPGRAVIAPRVLLHDHHPIPAPLRTAEATGRLEFRAEAPAARILLDDRGERAVGIEYVDLPSGERHKVYADRIVLCASAIETVRLLLASEHPKHPAGLGNEHDLLGRYVLDHNFVVGAGTTGAPYHALEAECAPRTTDPLDLGADIDFYVPDFSDDLPDKDFVRGFGIQGRITPTSWGMGAFGEMLPQPDNRVTLSDRLDAAGLRTARIQVHRGPNEQRMIVAQKAAIRALADAADLKIRMPLPALLRGLLWKAIGPEVGVMHLGVAIHEAGGARMGSDPRHSVTDPHNRLWSVPNVLVTDGACFPSTGCQNPTLTIMAVTGRACATME